MTATKLTITAITFEIRSAVSLIARSFDLSEQKLQEIRDYLSSFYFESLNYSIQPKVLAACLIWHMKDCGQLYVTTTQICKLFKVHKRWLRKSKRKYLEKMGIELMPSPSQMMGSGSSSLQTGGIKP